MISKYDEADSLIRSIDSPESIERGLSILAAITDQHPEDPKAWFERAGAFDFLGREEEALPHYERVRLLGIDRLPQEDRPRLFLQMGSTLRNLKRYKDSVDLLQEGIRAYPEFHALKAFLALTLYTSGDIKGSAKLLFQALLGDASSDSSTHIYRRALAGYFESIDSFPEKPLLSGSIDHIEIYVSNLEKSYTFWASLLKALGYSDFQSWGNGWSGGRSFFRGEAYFVIVQAESVQIGAGFHRKRIGLNHVAFRVSCSQEVDRVADLMAGLGHKPLYPERHPFAGGKKTYAVFIEDPDRIKVEIVAK